MLGYEVVFVRKLFTFNVKLLDVLRSSLPRCETFKCEFKFSQTNIVSEKLK